MGIVRRLGARAVAGSHATSDDDSHLTTGPDVVYAHILDGERLWLALPPNAGQPALRDAATGEIVYPDDDLPDDSPAADLACTSVRWRLTEVLPAENGVERDIVALREDGASPQAVRIPALPPNHPTRLRGTSDGAWQFEMVRRTDGTLAVRRGRARQVAQVLRVALVDRSAALTIRGPDRQPAELLLLDEDGHAAARMPMDRVGDGFFERIIGQADLPPETSSYRVAFGSADRHVPVIRARNDLHITDANAVPLPSILAEDDREAARMRFGRRGRLRIVRLDPRDAV
jgi:hypothetical protein